MKKTGIELIAVERERQVSEEGWTSSHDGNHEYGQLAEAAACYATSENRRAKYRGQLSPDLWPFDHKWWKPTPDDRVRELVKAGALIAAEIDRLQDI